VFGSGWVDVVPVVPWVVVPVVPVVPVLLALEPVAVWAPPPTEPFAAICC
jgi:hypothetical protein